MTALVMLFLDKISTFFFPITFQTHKWPETKFTTTLSVAKKKKKLQMWEWNAEEIYADLRLGDHL